MGTDNDERYERGMLTAHLKCGRLCHTCRTRNDETFHHENGEDYDEVGIAFLPHQCKRWRIGNADDLCAMIEDALELHARMTGVRLIPARDADELRALIEDATALLARMTPAPSESEEQRARREAHEALDRYIDTRRAWVFDGGESKLVTKADDELTRVTLRATTVRTLVTPAILSRSTEGEPLNAKQD